MISCIVAGGDALGPDLARSQQELVEFEVVIAEGAGDRRSAGEVLGDERADDLLLKSLLSVDEIVGDSKVFGDASRVVDVVDGATAALDGLGHGVTVGGAAAGETALIPELQREADKRMSLGMQKRCYSRRVDAAGHGHGDDIFLQAKPPS
jgi:hypothetical protein